MTWCQLAACMLATAVGCRRAATDVSADDAGSASGERDDDRVAPVEVTCEPVRVARAVSRIELRGVVAVPPDRSAVVSSAVPGRVLDVRVHEGDRVEPGALLAAIEDPALHSAVAEGEAITGAARAALENADAALARAKRLVDQGIAPRRDSEDAAARRANAEAELTSAAAKWNLARRQQDRARVVAPIAGVIVHVLRRAGELVDGTAATPLVEIADPTTLELRADVPAAQLVRVATGLPADVTLDAVPDQHFRAELVAVSPAVDPVTALGGVRARLTAIPADVHLALGLTGTLHLDLSSTRDEISIPAVALRRGIDGAAQVVVCDGSVAKLQVVTVGARDGDRVVLLAGLTADQRVVTSHVVGIESGTALVVRAPR
jgi:RND family efflux transporter MFP subunit